MKKTLYEERLDIYNIDRIKTGQTFRRGNPPGENGYYLVVQTIIFNSKGEMLIQQRQKDKKGWPNLWDISAGGSALAGENSREAAMRELKEELGITVDLSHRRPNVCSTFEEGYTDVYLLELDVSLSNLLLQKSEVQAVRYASEKEIHQMIDDGIFLPYYKSWISFLFDSRKQYGSFRH